MNASFGIGPLLEPAWQVLPEPAQFISRRVAAQADGTCVEFCSGIDESKQSKTNRHCGFAPQPRFRIRNHPPN
jgi:hypothetical protein